MGTKFKTQSLKIQLDAVLIIEFTYPKNHAAKVLEDSLGCIIMAPGFTILTNETLMETKQAVKVHAQVCASCA